MEDGPGFSNTRVEQTIFFRVHPEWDLHRVITAFKISGLIPEQPDCTRKLKMVIIVEDVDISKTEPVVVIVPIANLAARNCEAVKHRIESTKEALRRYDGDIAAAARELGLTYEGVRKRIKSFRIRA